ncbi:hypothetical protein G6F37_008007 [Rhizopus arrhizus]|nr:hypothetical protein G6F38_008222 [Rhizopus arrhizus]KAG1156011.1 hypothetical protein G6F37_008007 [Rhizopus arrhizus]
MARDLCSEVEKLMAALCALRIISRVPAILERMPVPEPRTIIRNSSNLDNSYSIYSAFTSKSKSLTNQDLILDLMGTSRGDSGVVDSSISAISSQQSKNSNTDLLVDLFSGTSSSSASTLADISTIASKSNSLMNLYIKIKPHLTELPMSISSKPISGSITGFEAYSKNGLSVQLLASKDSSNPAIINIQVLFSSSGSYGVISNLQFQAAVPKS